MTKDHSTECKNLEIIKPTIKKEINKWEEYKELCINFLETTDNYNKNYLLKEFNKIYEKGEYEFLKDEKKLLNIIKTWKRNSLKFTQFSIFDKKNLLNNENEIFLREYKFFYSYDKKS